MPKPQKYEYQALKPGNIRLLKFGDCSIGDKSSIAISLDTFKIEEVPPYFALSYCWARRRRRKKLFVMEGLSGLPRPCSGLLSISVCV